jgi:membrane protease YdiL (CAAX protease family)
MAAVLFSKDAKAYLGLNTKIKSTVGFLVIALMIAVVPFINWMMTVNEAMKLPASLSTIESWMKQSEISAAEITKLFLQTTSIGGLLTNMFIIAIIPAIGEELLFRGVIQKLFGDLANNKHVGIVLGAFLFSAMHMQFYGFLPRFALGIMLGYLYLWSGSLWLPMLAHFLNNGMAILFAWMEARKGLPFNQDTFGAEPGQEMILALSVFLTWGLLFFIRKLSLKP